MIVYLETSALVPLLIEEPTTGACQRIWNDADAVTSTRLTYVEATAALAQAQRLERLRTDDLADLRQDLDEYWMEVDVIEMDEELIQSAAQRAVEHELRGYDAVHCAAAERVDDPELVAVTGDRRLFAAWQALGVAVADTTVSPDDITQRCD